ncbi:hypothetical protein BGZ57DRAFT_987662 [Hyaloscypha finlandica]|nr:hypothetical protein BGZ57DRAFT_987662 [Hyaloscypha finlandica]
MATSVLILYAYVPTAPRSKSVTACCKPTSKQPSIFDKVQRIKPSGAAPSMTRLVAAAAAGERGHRPGILGTGTVHRGSDKESEDENGDGDDGDNNLPIIEGLLFAVLQEQGFTKEDRGSDKAGLRDAEAASEESGGSISHIGLAQSNNSGRSLDDPIVLLDDNISSTQLACLFDSLENANDSTTRVVYVTV